MSFPPMEIISMVEVSKRIEELEERIVKTLQQENEKLACKMHITIEYHLGVSNNLLSVIKSRDSMIHELQLEVCSINDKHDILLAKYQQLVNDVNFANSNKYELLQRTDKIIKPMCRNDTNCVTRDAGCTFRHLSASTPNSPSISNNRKSSARSGDISPLIKDQGPSS